MAIEYLSTDKVAEIMKTTNRQARVLMRKIGLVKVGRGMIRRDALDRYLAMNTERTIYTKPLLEESIKPKYDRYRRTGT